MATELPLNQVLHGNCIEILETLPEKSVDLIFADPPYNLQLQNALWRPNLTLVDAVDDAWDRFDSFAEYDRFTLAWLTACRRVLKDTGTIWVIGSYHNIYRIGPVMQDLGYWFLNDVVWVKCLSGDTELLAQINGAPIVSTIKDLARIDPQENHIQLPSYDDQGCSTWVDLVHWQNNGKSEGLYIQLEDGNWVECTREHRFPVAQNGEIVYREAKDLKPGDELLQLGRFDLPVTIQSHNIDRKVGCLIGWYLAEGSYLGEEKGIQLSMSADEKGIAEDLIRIVQEKFGVIGRIHIYNQSLILVFPGRFMMELIRRFVRGENAKTKRLTREAFYFGTQFLEGVLEGYLQGDAHWDEKNQRWRIGFTKNKSLVIDLGVICRLTGHRLHFNHGFVPYKDSKVEIIRGEIRENSAGNWDYVHLETIGLPSRRFFSNDQGYSIKYFNQEYKLITRKSPDGRMTDFAEKVLHGDLRICKIKSIQTGSHKTFYDLAVSGNHVFALANGLLTHNSNPMPNFRGVRFTNAHETLIWASKAKGARYTFNHHAMKSLNDDKQMRSDWVIPICSGSERLKVNGKKAHSTQKPEALLYRVILSSSRPGDIVLDPFFGTGTTGAVAKKLHRQWIGIEKELGYVELARQRIQALAPDLFPEGTYHVDDEKRLAPRVAFATLVEQGLLVPGQELYFRPDKSRVARIRADGQLALNGYQGSIHGLGKQLLNGAPCNGWDNWLFQNEQGEFHPIDDLRQQYLGMIQVELEDAEEGKETRSG